MPRGVKMPSGSRPAAKRPAGGAKRTNKLYTMPEKISEGTVLTDLSKVQWRIGPSIGVGGFGEIYSACRLGEKNYDYVVKCEPHGNGPLFVEMHFYMRNAKLEDIESFKRERGLKTLGMPYMVGNGSTELKGQKHRFIVMPRYGSDVGKHFVANGRRLPESTAYRLALQLLDVYEFVHSCGYVHADLKGANILLGYGRGGGAQTYLVDYGLASHYTTKEFKPDPKKMHNGTIEYTSRDAHLGVATMRADLEILGYNLVDWLGVQLPWVRDRLLATPAKVQKAKEDFMADVGTQLKKLFANGAVPAAIGDYMKYVAKMKYNEQPDYDKCRKMFVNALKVLRVPHSGDLDFKGKATATITNNNNNNEDEYSPSPSKKQKRSAAPAYDSSLEMICASDEDDGNVIFEKKTPVKAAPATRPLKTTAKMAAKLVSPSPSPRKTAGRKSPLKLTPSPTRRKPIHVSPSPVKTKASKTKPVRKPSPAAHKRVKATAAQGRSASSTPLSAGSSSSLLPAGSSRSKANINFSPVISAALGSASRTRHGKTVINDQVTPNASAGKTYEFNFELDVSVDANVIVNVKRKKKATKLDARSAANSSATATSTRNDDDDSPATRVKVRKIASADDTSNSSSTPAVTVRKSKR